MFVAQLVERSLPIPEVRGLNPVIGKKIIYIEHLFTVNCVLKRRKYRKRGRDWPIFLKKTIEVSLYRKTFYFQVLSFQIQWI